jgi:hypothetical protein
MRLMGGSGAERSAIWGRLLNSDGRTAQLLCRYHDAPRAKGKVNARAVLLQPARRELALVRLAVTFATSRRLGVLR